MSENFHDQFEVLTKEEILERRIRRKQQVRTHTISKNEQVVLTPTLFCLSGKIRSAKMERSLPDQFLVGYLLFDAGDRFSSRKHWYLFLKHKLPLYAKRLIYQFTHNEICDLIDFIMLYMEPKTVKQLRTTHILKEYLFTRYGLYTMLQIINEFGHMNALRVVETRDTITIYGLSELGAQHPNKGICINKNNIKPYAQMLLVCWQNMKREYSQGYSSCRTLVDKFMVEHKAFENLHGARNAFTNFVMIEGSAEIER